MRDVTFDARRPFWNGQPIQIERRFAKADRRPMTIGTFRFSDVVIPSGVTIRFQGFDVVLLQSSGDMTINGAMDVSGGDGKPGTLQQAGDGGNGGMAQGTTVGGSAGFGGYGWNLMAVCDQGCNLPGPGLGGELGAGQNPFLSPGRPRLQFITASSRPCTEPGFQSFYVGGGSGAGGGNGSRGANGQGQIVNQFDDDDDIRSFRGETSHKTQYTAKSGRLPSGARPPSIPGRAQRLQDDDDDPPIGTWGEYDQSVGGPSFGQPIFNLNIQSAGSGDGGDGPAAFNPDCGSPPSSGGGGGGGGGGGAIFLQAQGKIIVNSGGVIKANGGNGGNGAPNTFSGGGGGGAGGFIRLEAQLVQMNGGVLEAHGGRGGLGQEGAFNGGAGGGGRILIVGPVACAVPVTETIMAVSAETISCPAQDLIGRDASGDQLVGLPTVVAEQQQAQISIDSSFTFVAKEGQATATVTVNGIQNARVNLEIKPIEGQGEATFDDGSKMKTNVVVPAGNQLPVTIKGVKESSTKENLNLIATLASDTSTKDERKFSVVAVKKVEWLDKNGNALEDNNHPDFKIGKRVFPDATASGGKPQNTVKVRAIITQWY